MLRLRQPSGKPCVVLPRRDGDGVARTRPPPPARTDSGRLCQSIVTASQSSPRRKPRFGERLRPGREADPGCALLRATLRRADPDRAPRCTLRSVRSRVNLGSSGWSTSVDRPAGAGRCAQERDAKAVVRGVVGLGWAEPPDVGTIVVGVLVETAAPAGHLDAVRELLHGRQHLVVGPAFAGPGRCRALD